MCKDPMFVYLTACAESRLRRRLGAIFRGVPRVCGRGLWVQQHRGWVQSVDLVRRLSKQPWGDLSGVPQPKWRLGARCLTFPKWRPKRREKCKDPMFVYLTACAESRLRRRLGAIFRGVSKVCGRGLWVQPRRGCVPSVDLVRRLSKQPWGDLSGVPQKRWRRDRKWLHPSPRWRRGRAKTSEFGRTAENRRRLTKIDDSKPAAEPSRLELRAAERSRGEPSRRSCAEPSGGRFRGGPGPVSGVTAAASAGHSKAMSGAAARAGHAGAVAGAGALAVAAGAGRRPGSARSRALGGDESGRISCRAASAGLATPRGPGECGGGAPLVAGHSPGAVGASRGRRRGERPKRTRSAGVPPPGAPGAFTRGGSVQAAYGVREEGFLTRTRSEPDKGNGLRMKGGRFRRSRSPLLLCSQKDPWQHLQVHLKVDSETLSFPGAVEVWLLARKKLDNDLPVPWPCG
ncbi:uncharacterized protein FYW23_002754 [Sylvia borin]